MRAPVTLAIILSFSTLAHAQQVEKCCGTSSSTFLLGSPAYARHTQCLYAPGELTGAVVGQIHRLYYRYGNSGVALGNTLGNITISMVQTNATSFTGVNFLTGLQTVFQADSLTIAPGVSGDWFNFNLDALFNFDPSLSLVVDIRWETSANSAFGTMSVGNTTGRKIMSPDPSSPTGEAWNTLQDIGFALAIGILLDAFLVRLVLLPVLLRLTGQAAWYVPAWLRRILPKVTFSHG